MKIGIDARYLSHGLVGGIHTYLMSLIPALAQLGRERDFVLYIDDKCAFDLESASLPPNTGVRVLPYRSALSSLRYDLFLRDQMAKDGIDVAHFPANYGFGPRDAATVVTVHDALTLTPITQMFRHKGSRRTLRSTLMTTYLHAASTRAVRNADLVLTVSEHARQDIAAHSGYPLNRIVPAPHAPADDMRPICDETRTDEARSRLELPERFVLADALKNPGVLIRAWRRLPEDLRSRCKIVFFSRHPEPLPAVFEAVASGDAHLLVRPNRSDLVTLYNLAEVFVFPSWYEGFGIPVLEAMACGTPVIASDRYSLPEVTGGAALLVDAEDDGTLANYLVWILGNPGEAQRLSEAGIARASQFSWERTAQIVLGAYDSARSLRKEPA